MKKRIVYFSEAHIEINGMGRLNCTFAKGDILIIAGDTLNAKMSELRSNDKKARKYKKAVEHLKKNVFPHYEAVLYVMGNHDHYDYCFYDTETQLRNAMSDVPNFYILENDSIFLHGVLYLGASLWTDYDRNHPLAFLSAREGMNDYRLIYKDNIPYIPSRDRPRIAPVDCYEKHMQTREYFNKTLKEYAGVPTVVITHHAPSFSSCRSHHVGLNHCYASNLEDMILDNPQILTWIHGHTHKYEKYQIGDTWILANQCGYYVEPFIYYNFRPNSFFDIEDGKLGEMGVDDDAR